MLAICYFTAPPTTCVGDALARAVPLVAGAVVVIVDAFQLTVWKARHLTCFRGETQQDLSLSSDTRDTLRHGVRLGLRCCCTCAGPTAVLLVVGVMDLHARVVVMATITAECLVPHGLSVVRTFGAIFMLAGSFWIAQAAALV